MSVERRRGEKAFYTHRCPIHFSTFKLVRDGTPGVQKNIRAKIPAAPNVYKKSAQPCTERPGKIIHQAEKRRRGFYVLSIPASLPPSRLPFIHACNLVSLPSLPFPKFLQWLYPPFFPCSAQLGSLLWHYSIYANVRTAYMRSFKKYYGENMHAPIKLFHPPGEISFAKMETTTFRFSLFISLTSPPVSFGRASEVRSSSCQNRLYFNFRPSEKRGGDEI